MKAVAALVAAGCAALGGTSLYAGHWHRLFQDNEWKEPTMGFDFIDPYWYVSESNWSSGSPQIVYFGQDEGVYNTLHNGANSDGLIYYAAW